MTARYLRVIGLLLAAGFLARGADAQTRAPAVDFRYAPATHLTAICFPGDWQKTVVTERGSLAYDFGPGPYVRPLTEISVGAKEVTLTPGTPSIADPRVPIVSLRLDGAESRGTIEEFALEGKTAGRPSGVFLGGKLRRLGGLNGAPGWASPPAGCDPAFRNAAWGTNRPILYRVRVPAGSSRLIALGFCEPYKGTKGQRVLELRVEGAPPVTIDALKDNVKNTPYVYFFNARDENDDGEIAIEVHASPEGADPNTILNAFWVFSPGTRITEADVIGGEGTRRAEIAWSCGLENETGAPSTRVDGILARFEGRRITPVVTVATGRLLEFDESTGALGAPGRPFVVARPRFRSAIREGNTWTLELPGGTTEAQVYVLAGGDPRAAAAGLPDLREARKAAERFWKNDARLPFGRITVPDSAIQYLLDASIRNMYQIAEWVDGGFQFEPGPSVYRGLWMHDEVWDIQSATALGDTASARLAVENALRYQMPDGRIRQSEPYPMLRETGLILYAACEYAKVTGNTGWLRARLPAISSGVSWIRKTRAQTLSDPSSAVYGLFPPGFTDGGIGGLSAEYGTTFWSLNGLSAAVGAAWSLGLPDSARSWNALASDLMRSFREAAMRDARRDAHGNLYLPMRVGDTSSTTIPQQANWGMLDAQAFGHLFPFGDPLLNGTLAMLDAKTTEGIHQDVGWLRQGIWPFFTAQEGIVHVYQRNYARAETILYAVANHASPLGTWLEEQLPKDVGTRTSGDASDATASALFILLLRDMIANDRPDTVEVLGGVPPSWYANGARLRLDRVPTECGSLSLDVRVSADGKTCTLSTGKLPGGMHCTLRLVLQGLKEAGFRYAHGPELPASWDFPADEELRTVFTRRR